jgi:gliding motility-associated-like protein
VNTAQVTVDVFSVNLSGQSAVCPGGTVQLGVDGGVSWTWSPANLVSSPTAQNPTATVNVSTVFTVAVSNGQGCIVLGQLNVDVFPPALANAGNDLVACGGAPVILNGSGGVVYQWSPATYLSSTTVPAPVATPEQDISYTLTVTDANGCTATDVMNVSVLPSPSASVSPDVEICIGQSTQLTASGGVTYSWSPIIAMDDPNSATPTVAPFQPTTYTVTVTDANGCSDNESVTVSIFTVAAFASPDGTVCLGDSLLLAATNGTTFSWAPQTGLSNPGDQSTYALPSENITYVVTATSATGCDATASVDIFVNPNPIASFTAEFVPTCEGVRGRFTKVSNGADYYRWNTSVDGTSALSTNLEVFFPNGSGPIVSLTAFANLTLCFDTLTIDFSGQNFTNDSVDVFWPNVITPNQDGLNDCFRPGFIGEFSDCYELIVYNRWGALIFESIGTGNCWDGRTKAGTLMPEGTYYFISRVLDEEKAGWVQLIRD